MIKVLIADDHTIVREGLKQILAETPDMVVADEANNGQEVMDKISRRNFDVILLDISMPGRSGLDILMQIKAEKPKTAVLMLSMYSEEQYVLRSLKAGASGYLTKESASDELIEAIRKVYNGRKYISPALAEKIVFHIDEKKAHRPHEGLSNREFQVLCLIASGKTVKEISGELSLSVKTISTYRSRILEKMSMSSNAALTRYAIENNLV